MSSVTRAGLSDPRRHSSWAAANGDIPDTPTGERNLLLATSCTVRPVSLSLRDCVSIVPHKTTRKKVAGGRLRPPHLCEKEIGPIIQSLKPNQSTRCLKTSIIDFISFRFVLQEAKDSAITITKMQRKKNASES